MKKLILFAVIAFIFVGCGRKEDATASIDISTAESQRDSLISLVAEISTNISELARLESIVHSQNFKDGQRQEVLTGISDIKEELSVRRMRLEELGRLIQKSDKYSEDLKKEIDTQLQLIDSQSDRMADLQRRLSDADGEIGRLESEADSLRAEVGSLEDAKNAAERQSRAIADELNACYYVIGTRDELKEHGVLEKKFLGRSKVLEADFDRSFFTRADKRTLREIVTNYSKIKILTKQPVNSYVIVDGGDGNKIVRIDNSTLFWEKSDFLVIEAK